MSRKEENISVAVRIRPLMRRERQQGYTEVWRTDSNRSVYCSASSFPDSYAAAKRDVKFTFDQVFGPQALNQEVYEKMGEKIVWSAMEGFNGTMFVYGQTASGKTYTMKGTKKNPGTIPLAIQDVFSYIKQTPEREFLLRVSYLEIYNEVINDLLSPENGNLKIHESPEKGVFVGGLKEEIVLSPEQVMSIIAAGEAHRHVGATNFNEMSSRSHTIFRMVIESKPVSGVKRSGNIRESTGDSSIGSPVRVSTLNLIDLAGSEKATGKGIQRQEGAFINKSLLTLGNVISRLSQKKEGHIPYRDSKLTRILEPSLSGNARIAIICTLSPTPPCFEETHNTLKFANRAKRITNRARLNEVLDDKALIQKYKNQIHELQRRLQEVKAKELEMQQQRSEVTELEKKSLEQSNATLIQRLQEQEEVRVSLEQKINRLTKLILVSTSIATPVKPPNRLWRGSTSTSSAAAAVVAGRSPAAALLSRAASFEKMNGVGGDGLLPVISPRARRNLDLSFGIHGSPASNGVSYRHVNGKERSSSSASSDEEESEKNQAQPTATNAENGSSSLHSLSSPPSPSSPSSSAISPFPEKFRVFRGRKGSIRGSTGRDHAFTSPVSEDPGSVKRLQIRLQEQEEEIASLQSTINSLREVVSHKQQKLQLLKFNARYAKQQLSDVTHELQCKDALLLRLDEELQKRDKDLRAAVDAKTKEHGLEVLTGVVTHMHAHEVTQLRSQIVDAEIKTEVLRADNKHLVSQLEEKDELIREWVDFFEYYEHKQQMLEEELRLIKAAESRKDLREDIAPKYYSE